MNKISFVGRFTKDPILQKMNSDLTYCRFSVACKGKTLDENGKRKSMFFPCIAWRQRADTISKFCKKGDLVSFVGQLNIREWTDKNGENKTTWEIEIDDFEFLVKATRTNDEIDQPKWKQSAEQERQELTEIDDDDLPF